jgi:hypothetical protein
MDRALPVVGGFSNLRSFAFALLGLDACDTTRNEPHRFELMKRLADRIHAAYLANSEGGWNWFEPLLTYDNARLPQALLLAGLRIGNNQMVQSALSALDWLVHVQADAEGKFLPIGSDGFYFKGSKRAIYDQQPIEAVATLQACQSALALGREDHWEHEAWRAFAWFLGANSTGEPVYDETTGGCHDAVTKKGVNHNEGAESTLAFLSALLSIRKVDEPSRSKGNLLYFE